MNRHTIKTATDLMAKIAGLEQHKQQIEQSIADHAKHKDRKEPILEFRQNPNYSDRMLTLYDDFLIVDTASILKIYLAKIEKKQQEYEAQLDALQDTPEPGIQNAQSGPETADVEY